MFYVYFMFNANGKSVCTFTLKKERRGNSYENNEILSKLWEILIFSYSG